MARLKLVSMHPVCVLGHFRHLSNNSSTELLITMEKIKTRVIYQVTSTIMKAISS